MIRMKVFSIIGLVFLVLIMISGCGNPHLPHMGLWANQVITSVDFISPHEGWVTTETDQDKVSLYHTKDSGGNWKQETFPQNEKGELSGGFWIHFFNSKIGFMDG